MFYRYLVTFFILFQSFNLLSQAGQNYFRLTAINNSNGKAIFWVHRYEADTVIAGEKKDIVYKLGDDPLSFYISVMTTDTSSPSVQNYYLPILNTRSKEIVITSEGKIEYELTSEEKIVSRYRPIRKKDFWKLDSIIYANSSNLIAPDIIYWSICRLYVPTDSIQKYYNMLSPEISSSDFGTRIFHYLENRSRLAIGKTLNNFELPDATGKIVQLKAIKSDYILLDFWFIRCGACITSFPEIEELYWKTKRSKLEIIGISIDKKADNELWQITIIKYYMAWINLNDSDRKVVEQLAIGYYPTRILLDKDRKIILLDTDNSQADFFKKVNQLANK